MEDVSSYQPFVYQPLDATRKQIRLFRLDKTQPNREQGYLSGSLDTFEINHCPQYRALSYEWGVGEAAYPILVNGSILKIRKNLLSFLRQFARAEFVSNQSHVNALEERFANDAIQQARLSRNFEAAERIAQSQHEGSARQVLQSTQLIHGAIARRTGFQEAAERLVRLHDIREGISDQQQVSTEEDAPSLVSQNYIWIDQICINQSKTPERNDQVQIMSEIFRKAHEVVSWLGCDHKCEAYLQTEAQLGAQGDDQRKQAELKAHFCKLSYWGRLWIQQEVLLAREVVFMAKSSMMSCSHLRLCSPTFRNTPSALQLMLDKPNLSQEDNMLPLAFAIRLLSHNICSDPRDKVFGLLGVVHPKERLAVNYNLSPVKVFNRALSIALYSASVDFLDKYSLEYTFLELAQAMGISHPGDLARSRDAKGNDLTKIMIAHCGYHRAQTRHPDVRSTLTTWPGLQAENGFVRKIKHLMKPSSRFVGAVGRRC